MGGFDLAVDRTCTPTQKLALAIGYFHPPVYAFAVSWTVTHCKSRIPLRTIGESSSADKDHLRLRGGSGTEVLMPKKRYQEGQRNIDLLEKLLVVQLFSLGVKQDQIARIVGRQKAWVNGILKGIPTIGK